MGNEPIGPLATRERIESFDDAERITEWLDQQDIRTYDNDVFMMMRKEALIAVYNITSLPQDLRHR